MSLQPSSNTSRNWIKRALCSEPHYHIFLESKAIFNSASVMIKRDWPQHLDSRFFFQFLFIFLWTEVNMRTKKPYFSAWDIIHSETCSLKSKLKPKLRSILIFSGNRNRVPATAKLSWLHGKLTIVILMFRDGALTRCSSLGSISAAPSCQRI